ncbi:MAG: hypothetical protein AB1465_06565 [Patescibacteria group bacterium]
MTPNVKFYICSLEEVAERIFSFKEEFRQKVNKNYSSIFITLTDFIKEELKTKKRMTPALKKKIVNILKKEYPTQKNLQKFKENLEKEWSKVNDLFFNSIGDKCSFKWPYKTFKIGILYGVCGHYGNKHKIYVPYADFRENEFFYPAFVIGEELFHIGYWDYFEKEFKIKIDDPYEVHLKNEKFSIWQISELLPEYYLKSPPFRKFHWHKFNRISGYPWLEKIKKISDPLWKKNITFSAFVTRLHRKCKCYPK